MVKLINKIPKDNSKNVKSEKEITNDFKGLNQSEIYHELLSQDEIMFILERSKK